MGIGTGRTPIFGALYYVLQYPRCKGEKIKGQNKTLIMTVSWQSDATVNVNLQ